MNARFSIATSAALALLGPAPATAQDASAAHTRVAFHESPAIELYFHVRVAEAAATSAPFAAAAQAAKALDRALGGQTLAWGPLDGLLPGCQTVADVRAAFERAPKTLTFRGAEIELRKPALELAQALVPAEAAFAEPWKERQERLHAARGVWEALVGAKERALLDFHLKSLGMADPGIELPVYLIGDAPWPGALTVFDEQRRGVSFVGVNANADKGSLFLEIVLHELTHSLDIASGDGSALGELRQRLGPAAGGERRPDLRLPDPAHVLMFVQSAESIRRVIDPAHTDYGTLEKVYERLGASAELVRGLWSDYLDGKLTRSAALDEIAAGLAPAPK